MIRTCMTNKYQLRQNMKWELKINACFFCCRRRNTYTFCLLSTILYVGSENLTPKTMKSRNWCAFHWCVFRFEWHFKPPIQFTILRALIFEIGRFWMIFVIFCSYILNVILLLLYFWPWTRTMCHTHVIQHDVCELFAQRISNTYQSEFVNWAYGRQPNWNEYVF